MFKTIYSVPVGGSGYNFQFHIEIPGKCPLCDVAYGDNPITSYYICADTTLCDSPTMLYAVYYCPHCVCCFFAEYTITSSENANVFECSLYKVHPVPTTVSEFSNSIKRISPRFVEIFHQAEKAEYSSLDEIAGLGYRKALEFLLKDYAIHEHPEDIELIKCKPLSQCIKSYISEESIKTLAERSAWIGNDEAHYIRKQQDRDVSDMKSFIQAIVYFIGMKLITEDARSMTPQI